MQYEDALKKWAADRYRDMYQKEVDASTITVTMEFDAGWNCCGGLDPNCYCSMAEPPRAYIEVKSNGKHLFEISQYEFDFVEILQEILIAGGNEIHR